MRVTTDDIRRFAVARSLHRATSLKSALERLAFVQADPIRAPARAQDLVLRHRVARYRAGDLERRYAALGIEEDVFVNYGFVTRWLQALMHPRSVQAGWTKAHRERARHLLAFVRAHGEVHPRAVDEHFAHGRVRNYWGGSSSATTHLLEAMHYAGLLRVARRDAGIRIYAAREPWPVPENPASRRARVDALVDVAVNVYAPLPPRSLSHLVSRIRYAAPQWRRDLKAAIDRAKTRLSQARVDGVDWFWPAGEHPTAFGSDREVRLLAPFDPIAWDRRRFEHLWGWAYRFEAYTPVHKRQLGYYALPLLWHDHIIGWGNVSMKGTELHATFGYVGASPARDRAFASALDDEISRMRTFLGLESDRSRGEEPA
jgi:uncharacterized protein YcaQ